MRVTCDKKKNLTSKRNLIYYFILPESSTEINSCDGTPVNQTATSSTQFKKKHPTQSFYEGGNYAKEAKLVSFQGCKQAS